MSLIVKAGIAFLVILIGGLVMSSVLWLAAKEEDDDAPD